MRQRWGCGCMAALAAGIGFLLLVWPFFKTSSEVYRRAACYSNLKQLGTALQMYSEDFEGYLPPAEMWQREILVYTKNERSFKCPSHRGTRSYAMNRNAAGGSVKQAKDPEKTVLLFESDLDWPNAVGREAAVAHPPRHLGGNNFAFLDGHVRRLRVIPPFGAPLLQPKPGRQR